LFGSEYLNAPVSPLYVFGRHQDVALQKARDTVSQRNHLRLWLAPFTIDGLGTRFPLAITAIAKVQQH
jgi:hypothetical protein